MSACEFPNRLSEVNVVIALPVFPSQMVALRPLTVTNRWHTREEQSVAIWELCWYEFFTQACGVLFNFSTRVYLHQTT